MTTLDVVRAETFTGEYSGQKDPSKTQIPVVGGHSGETIVPLFSKAFPSLQIPADKYDGVGDDQNEGLGGELGNALDEIPDNAGVDLEQVITGHARLPGNTSRDDNNIGASKSVLQAVILGQVTGDFSDGGDVREIGSDTGGVDDIVESKLIDKRACLQQEG